MSSPYPTLDNRPIDQWKVTQLKEELKRRKLQTKGLKEDLIKRLDESIRVEREELERLEQENLNKLESESAEKIIEDNAEKADNAFSVNEDPHGADAKTTASFVDGHDTAENDGHMEALNQPNVKEDYTVVDKQDATIVWEEWTVQSTAVETTENVVSYIDSGEGSHKTDATKTSENLNIQLDNEGSEPIPESLDSKPLLENVDPKPQLISESFDATDKDAMLKSSSPNNQVSEVSTVLGSEVKYDNISTDSDINEKTELKDNIIADHVKIELDVNGDSHLMDVEEPPEGKTSVRERDDNYDTNADISKNNENAYVGYSEKLNLERSSGDDSMDEDVLDNKQYDSKDTSTYVGDTVEKTEIPIAMEDSRVDVVGDDMSSDQVDMSVQNKYLPALPAEKRKLNDKAAIAANEPAVKRRRWNSESLKVPQPQESLTPTTTPKDTSQNTILKRNFSRSNSTMSEDSPKERVVPPSNKPPTNSLRIDNFLRPFTHKAVDELLGKTGKVIDFWMDQIKTHCFVSYSSVEEAVETRNAVYNMKWPTNGGRLLVADFVDPQEVQSRVQNPQTPVAPAPANLAPSLHQASPRLSRQQLQQQLPSPPSLSPPPPLSGLPPRERLPLPPPPLELKKLILRLSLWMISSKKPKQPLESITYLYPRNK